MADFSNSTALPVSKVSRRFVLGGIAAAPAATLPAVAVERPLSPHDQVMRHVLALSALMKSIYGGGWSTHVNHEVGIVAITHNSWHQGRRPELHRVVREDGTVTDTWL